jgi:hypothetical protein
MANEQVRRLHGEMSRPSATKPRRRSSRTGAAARSLHESSPLSSASRVGGIYPGTPRQPGKAEPPTTPLDTRFSPTLESGASSGASSLPPTSPVKFSSVAGVEEGGFRQIGSPGAALGRGSFGRFHGTRGGGARRAARVGGVSTLGVPGRFGASSTVGRDVGARTGDLAEGGGGGGGGGEAGATDNAYASPRTKSTSKKSGKSASPLAPRASRAPAGTTNGDAALRAGLRGGLRGGGGSLHALPSLSSKIVTVESVSRLASTYAREMNTGVHQCEVLLHMCRIVAGVGSVRGGELPACFAALYGCRVVCASCTCGLYVRGWEGS